jgi:hypothetical protein
MIALLSYANYEYVPVQDQKHKQNGSKKKKAFGTPVLPLFMDHRLSLIP